MWRISRRQGAGFTARNEKRVAVPTRDATALPDTGGRCEVHELRRRMGQRLQLRASLRFELAHAFGARRGACGRDAHHRMHRSGSGVHLAAAGELARHLVERGLGRARVTLGEGELGLQQSVKAAVLDGFGITVISRLAVERELADGSLVALALEGAGLERSFFAVRHAGRTPKRVTQAFVDFARTALGDMAAPASAA